MAHKSKPVYFLRLLISLALMLAVLLAPAWQTAVQAAEGPNAAEETALSGPRQPETLSAGHEHTCAVKSDGNLACWGNNDWGQATPPGGTFTQISAGDLFSCGIKSDGTLACWGDNTFGEAPKIHISPANLPHGTTGTAYSEALTASSGRPPYSFSIAAGSLPPGLTLSSAGLLSGMPTASGAYTFSVQALDSFPLAGSQTCTLQIDRAEVYLPVIFR